MLAFLNHKTGKLIYTDKSEEIPRVGLAVTGWEQISQEEFRRIVNLGYVPDAWNYPQVSLYKKIRNNPENSRFFTDKNNDSNL